MNETFSIRLKKIRESKGWTQQQFAEKIGCSRATFNHYENGNRHPDDIILKAICQTTNVSADYLLGLSSTKNPTLDSTAKATGLSEKALEYLRVKKNTTNESGTGIENTILDFLIRDADQYDIFNYYNPNPFIAETKFIFGKASVPTSDTQDKCPIHILDALKNDWGDDDTPPSPEALEYEKYIESLGGYKALDPYYNQNPFLDECDSISLENAKQLGFLSIDQEDFLEKQENYFNETQNNSYFLDTLIKYLLFDKYQVSLCSFLGYQDLDEDHNIILKLGNTAIHFPSEESSQLIEDMLIRNVLDSLKILKKNFKKEFSK